MLIRCIRCEKLKLKHSILWLACLGIPLIPAHAGLGQLMDAGNVILCQLLLCSLNRAVLCLSVEVRAQKP